MQNSSTVDSPEYFNELTHTGNGEYRQVHHSHAWNIFNQYSIGQQLVSIKHAQVRLPCFRLYISDSAKELWYGTIVTKSLSFQAALGFTFADEDVMLHHGRRSIRSTLIVILNMSISICWLSDLCAEI